MACRKLPGWQARRIERLVTGFGAGGVTVWALSSLAESFSELMVLMGRFEADGLKEVAASKSSLRRHGSIFGADGLSKRMPALILSICSILWIL